MKLSRNSLTVNNLEELSIIDGSEYVHLLHHDNVFGTVFFDATDDPYSYVYHSNKCWSKMYLLNTVFKNLSNYEFCVIESNNGVTNTYKWSQTINPFKATYEDVTHANITCISNIPDNYGGMYLRVNSNDNSSHLDGDSSGKYNFFTFNNNAKGNWFGTMTCQIWCGGIPGYGITNDIGNKGSQDVYLKINLNKNLEKDFLFTKEIYEI